LTYLFGNVGSVIIVIIFYIFEAEWLLAKAKLAICSLTCVFRFFVSDNEGQFE